MIRARPLTDGLRDGDDGLSFWGKFIFDPGRNFIELLTPDDFVGYQFFSVEAKTASVMLVISSRMAL